MSVMSISVSAEAEVTTLTEKEKAMLTISRADIDKDGTYSTNDAAKLLRAAAGIELANEEYDIDLDGSVTLLDAQKMLKVSAGIEPLIEDNALLLAIFDENLDSVKQTKPGFTRTVTMVCPSVKVTTTGAPTGFSDLNVSNMEYKDYVNKFVSLMNTFPYNTMLDAEMKAELEEMKKSAVEIYKPQIETKTIAAASNSHYTYFPVNNLGWSCNLTLEDIKAISQTMVDGKIKITVTMGDYTYSKGQYPSAFSEKQKLPYGKIFNLPNLPNDGSTINSVALKNGVIVLAVDAVTGSVAAVDYSYSYNTDITAAKSEGSTLTMRTVTTANTNENYVMN